jgi:signal transduction histidine kinase
MATSRAKPKILIIEDETITAHNISRILTRLGYEVVGIATTGAQALDDAQRFHPDLLLADVGLEGDVDGITVAAQAQERWRIPAVFLTAFTDAETIRRARLAEPYGYLVKPFGEQELHATIEIALQQRGLAAERHQQTIASAQLLERTQEELAAATAQAFRSQEQERERIARDLHDDFAQRLALLQMDIESIEQSLPAEIHEGLKERFGSVRQSLEKLGNNLRELSHHLHPSILEHLGLPNALRQLAADSRFRAQHSGGDSIAGESRALPDCTGSVNECLETRRTGFGQDQSDWEPARVGSECAGQRQRVRFENRKIARRPWACQHGAAIRTSGRNI